MRVFPVFILSCLFPFFVLAEGKVSIGKVSAPHQLVEEKTQVLIALIEEARTPQGKNKRGYYYTNPNQYFDALAKIIDPIVDFPSFSRGVMGRFGTREYYSALKTQSEKEAFKQNYKRFIKEFKLGLINTYGKGLIAFNGQTVKVTPPRASDWALIDKGQMVDIIQNVKDKGKTYQIIFKMRPDKKGRWMLRNIIINNINLGELYKKQFESSMQKYNNDFSQVIDNWLKEIESTKADIK